MWVLIDIGCLECAIESHLIASYDGKDVERAYAHADVLEELNDYCDDHNYTVFFVPEAGFINPEYAELLQKAREDAE